MKKTQKEFLSSRVRYIPINTVRPNPQQPRRSFDETALRELADSIRAYGILQPLTVRDKSGFYELVAGERRLRAARIAGLREVPCLVAEVGEEDAALLALIENLQRRDLDYMEEAAAIARLIRCYGLSQQQAADKLGKSQPAIANKLRLLTLTPEQQQLCTASHLSERHARAALRLPEGRRTAALEKMARDKMSVRQADRLVDQMLAAPNGPSPCRRTIPMVRDVRFFVNTLQHAVDLMTQKGIAATTRCDKHDGCLEYIVRIPVSSDGTAGKVENGAKEEEGEFEVKV